MSKRHHVIDNQHTALASHKKSKNLADQPENLLIAPVINSSNHIITAMSENAELSSSNSCEIDEFISGTSTINKKEQLTHILINRNSNPKNMIHDFNSCTGRQLTAKYSRKQIVQFYLEEEKDLDQKDEDGFALLHILAEVGEYKLIRHVSCKVPNINIQNNEGYTPLHLAVANKHYNTVDTLISMGVDRNCKNCHNQTPLHIAVITGDIKMALLLSQYVLPDLKMRDKCGYTPITWAIVGRHDKLAELLIQEATHLNNPPFKVSTELHIAIEKGNIKLINSLLIKGANIDAQDEQGNTPLNLACALFPTAKEQYYKIIDLLLKQGANPELPNTQNNTAREIINTQISLEPPGNNGHCYQVLLKNLLSYSYNIGCIPYIAASTSIPTSVITKSTTISITTGSKTSFAQLISPSINAQPNDSSIFMDMDNSNINQVNQPEAEIIGAANVPTIMNVYSLTNGFRPQIAPQPQVKSQLDKITEAINTLQQKWIAANETYPLELYCFKTPDCSEYTQSHYINSFIYNTESFKILQAIAHNFADVKEFHKALMAVSNIIVRGNRTAKLFKQLGEELCVKEVDYKIKAEIKYLLQCVSLTELADILQYNAVKDKILSIGIIGKCCKNTLELTERAPSKHCALREVQQIDRYFNECKLKLENILPQRKKVEELINKVKTKYKELIIDPINSATHQNLVTNISTPSADMSDSDDDNAIIDVVNLDSPPNNIPDINMNYSGPAAVAPLGVLDSTTSPHNLE